MESKVKNIMDNNIIIDALFHTLFEDHPPTQDNTDIIDLLINGGVTAVSTTVVGDKYKGNLKTFLKEVYNYWALEEAFSDRVLIVYNNNDLIRAKKENKLGIILSLQGADSLEHDLRYVSLLHKLGVRIIQITYNQKNNLGNGVFEPNDQGLTRFGQQVIDEMNRLGIVVDLSHVGYKTSLDAIETSTEPVLFSHSNVKKLTDNPRNISDEQIKAATSKGGVIGLCPHSVFCSKNSSDRPTVDDFIDHIEYVMDLTGSDEHVGIGTDRWMRSTMGYQIVRREFEKTVPGFFGPFTGNEKHVKGFNYYDEWENLIDSLLKRNFTNEQISKVLGGNLSRLFQQVWNK